jgi:hypothetical protein
MLLRFTRNVNYSGEAVVDKSTGKSVCAADVLDCCAANFIPRVPP